ncbi:MAG: threonine synthase, partial [Saprospiraceae bacterium]|nr:threonine synthase [Saprospiraceae bacterium]
MKFYSTKNTAAAVDFRTAVSQGLPPDNGLYFPEELPQLHPSFINDLPKIHLHEVAETVAWPFVKKNLSKSELATIIERTLNFPIPLVQLHRQLHVLELFHGPTLAFKDVGARFLAGCLQVFAQQNDEALTILVATSGDTGSAVANAFLGLEGINVCVLYPSGKVSTLQEQQMTTLGQNITALEVNGTFDDCQQLVKQAFLDEDLKRQKNLTSANSINIARLLPQSFYYFHTFQQLDNWEEVSFSVPSGNLGNLCAGLFAR